jgi:hypothetical protein
MSRHRLTGAPLARINVRAASLLVPRSERSNWIAEWTAELHHLCHAPQDEVAESQHGDPLHFSLGAFHDAFWIRYDRLRANGLYRVRSGSATRCMLILVTAAFAAFLICLALPSAHNALLLLPQHRSADLVIISGNGYAGTQAPSIALSDYEEWTTDTANLFTQIAFYRPTTKPVYVAHHDSMPLSVAQASDNFLELLDLPWAHAVMPASKPGEPRLVLSRTAWRTLYHSDPHLVGRNADVGGRPVLIAAIIPDDDWRLPGKIDAVLLEDQSDLGALPSRTRGFVIARIRNSAFPPPRGGWRKMVETRDKVTRGFDCISVSHLRGQPPFVFLFSLLLASLALPATTALPLGDLPRRHDHLPGIVNARRWIFLLVKFALIILIVDLCSTDLSYGLYSSDPIRALYIQLSTAFPALLFGFRWILQDQRKRCPECLRLLSSPARVGQASCNLLSWTGTELFCVQGHGLLHIPELPTSWFSTQRWLCLDSSWRGLFPDSCSPSPGML